ncbi:MAG TPA: hypothetical protein VNJ52_09610 [Patescibacteria group bacterium]|nr:hypothetical protein [Patescibacteria group bacterium]
MAAVIRLDRNRLAPLLFLPLSALLAGCTQPLGPGYQIRRETVTVRYDHRAVAPAVYYSVRAVVRNTGNRPLTMLRIRAPRHNSPAAFAAPSSAGPPGPGSRPGSLPVPMEPPLRRGRSRLIPFGYLVPVRGGGVFLEPEDWFPSFLPPHGLFAHGEPWARKTEIDIFVPHGYRALTTGRLRLVRQGRPGGETEYVYEIRGRDFPPFLLIGQYEEGRIRARGRDVLFWTRRPFDSGCAQTVATEAAATATLYRSLFGGVGKKRGPIRMIEITPANSAAAQDSDAPIGTVPYGVLFSADTADVCRQPHRFFHLVDRDLAATWFGWAVRPEPSARAILGNGAGDYAALIAEEKRDGPGARERQVKDWLAEYDRLASRTRPLAPGNLGLHPTGDQRKLAGIQSALCLVALEDRLGAEPVRRALRDLVESLRGRAAGRDELRSALERQSGQNLYDFLNRWFGQAGIPAAFQQRYSAGKN